jgi:hypothetical protein
MRGNLGSNITALLVPGYGRIPAGEVEFFPPQSSMGPAIGPVTALGWFNDNIAYYQAPTLDGRGALSVPFMMAALLSEGASEASRLDEAWHNKRFELQKAHCAPA